MGRSQNSPTPSPCSRPTTAKWRSFSRSSKKATSADRKQKLAHQICTELKIHTAIEEEIFYPAFDGKIEEDLLEEACVEHDGAKILINEIEAASPADDFYDAKVKVLSEEIDHHVKEEKRRPKACSHSAARPMSTLSNCVTVCSLARKNWWLSVICRRRRPRRFTSLPEFASRAGHFKE